MSDVTRKSYRIRRPYYRDGVYAQPGDVVAIPADEPPSTTWVPSTHKPKHIFRPIRTKEETAALRAKLMGEGEDGEPALEPAADSTPKTMADAAKKHGGKSGRPSDRDVA